MVTTTLSDLLTIAPPPRGPALLMVMIMTFKAF